MLLGFISLFLTVFQPKVAALCMPEKLNRSMLPCPYVPLNQETSTSTEAAAPAAHRRLFTTEEEPPSSSSCSAVSTHSFALPASPLWYCFQNWYYQNYSSAIFSRESSGFTVSTSHYIFPWLPSGTDNIHEYAFFCIIVPSLWMGRMFWLQGHVQVISVEGLHQLHIFIFVMAVIHVCYSCLTVLVGLWQVSGYVQVLELPAHSQPSCINILMSIML